jgi:hypothetical protein
MMTGENNFVLAMSKHTTRIAAEVKLLVLDSVAPLRLLHVDIDLVGDHQAQMNGKVESA